MRRELKIKLKGRDKKALRELDRTIRRAEERRKIEEFFLEGGRFEYPQERHFPIDRRNKI